MANFSCYFPFEYRVGQILQDGFLPLSFEVDYSDDFSEWLSVEFLRINPDELPIPEAPDLRKQYLEYDLNILMERRIQSQVPDGRIVHQELLPAKPPILFAVIDLPGGSNIVEMVNGEAKPLDAVRGVYIVIHRGYSYVVSTQLSPTFGLDLESMSDEEAIERLRRDLQGFYGSCEFQS